ncbi:hypothetical protein CDL12_06519 [Handroanthus impetiginosus]|uniref:Transmembrane protein n=1 Tax=Handroanthus impetiginosus TaxID=429701 RepID=A0A2G9HTE5_9LAMI|nr:hypothetical protein CDL12_06519 [Handroanthus impetiginosus]
MVRGQEEIQFLGVFGILKESFEIVSSWRKIFTQITVSLIIPLSFIYLTQMGISALMLRNIMINEKILERTAQGTSSYYKKPDVLFSELNTFSLFNLGYSIFFISLALLSTSAVVYTVACIYTAKEITFKKVMSVVPKVWKRLMVTFIWNLIIIFAYDLVSLLVLILGSIILVFMPVLLTVFLVLLTIIYLIGVFYIVIIWQLAIVVSVLEESYGLNAMAKSQALIKGKMGVFVAVFSIDGLCFFGIQLMFQGLVVFGDYGIRTRIGFGILSLVLTSIWMLFEIVVQTIIYFVCKSYHNENIDKSSLADHLEGYFGEYVPLKVQLEHFEV